MDEKMGFHLEKLSEGSAPEIEPEPAREQELNEAEGVSTNVVLKFIELLLLRHASEDRENERKQ
jgi:hypothetical protein